MRTRRIHIILMTGMLMLVSVCAYPFEHFIRVSGDFSFAREIARGGLVWDNAEPMSLQEAQAIIGSGQMEKGVSGNGFAPALGVGYRLNHNHFLLDVGLGGEYRQSWLAPHDLTNAYGRGKDEEGLAYVGHYQWRNRRSVMRHAGLTLPITIGGEWDKWFFLVGVKGALDVWSKVEEQGLQTIDGTYERYMNTFEGMPNHGFLADAPYQCDPVSQATSFSLRACAEAGYCVYGASEGRYRLKQTVKVYVSVFGEYGFLTSRDAYTPFLLGVRATVLIPLPTKRECTCWKF